MFLCGLCHFCAHSTDKAPCSMAKPDVSGGGIVVLLQEALQVTWNRQACGQELASSEQRTECHARAPALTRIGTIEHHVLPHNGWMCPAQAVPIMLWSKWPSYWKCVPNTWYMNHPSCHWRLSTCFSHTASLWTSGTCWHILLLPVHVT